MKNSQMFLITAGLWLVAGLFMLSNPFISIVCIGMCSINLIRMDVADLKESFKKDENGHDETSN